MMFGVPSVAVFFLFLVALSSVALSVVASSFAVALARGRTHLAAPRLRYLFACDATLSTLFFLFVVPAGYADTLRKVKCLRIDRRFRCACQIMQKPPIVLTSSQPAFVDSS